VIVCYYVMIVPSVVHCMRHICRTSPSPCRLFALPLQEPPGSAPDELVVTLFPHMLISFQHPDFNSNLSFLSMLSLDVSSEACPTLPPTSEGFHPLTSGWLGTIISPANKNFPFCLFPPVGSNVRSHKIVGYETFPPPRICLWQLFLLYRKFYLPGLL